MTTDAIIAMPGLTRQALELGRSLSHSDWNRPTGCPGWTVHDVFIHLACTFREVADRSELPEPVAGSIERSNDVAVATFRHRGPERTLADYESLIAPALTALENQQVGPAADGNMDLDDAGSYPAHLGADSLVFDHYCHLTHDLTVPGALMVEIETNAATMSSTLAWLMAGVPQMSSHRLVAALERPVALVLTGPGGGSWTLMSSSERVWVTTGVGDVAARLTSDADEFVRWGTHRIDWQDADLNFEGDEALARAVTSAIKVF